MNRIFKLRNRFLPARRLALAGIEGGQTDLCPRCSGRLLEQWRHAVSHRNARCAYRNRNIEDNWNNNNGFRVSVSIAWRKRPAKLIIYGYGTRPGAFNITERAKTKPARFDPGRDRYTGTAARPPKRPAK